MPSTYFKFPQFSLLRLVALVTIVALAVGLFASARRNARLAARNQQLAAENKDYRNELGIFEVEDPTKIHAIRVPTEDDEPQRYRVYLPPGLRYTRCYKVNGIPEHGVPKRVNEQLLLPGHYLFTVDIERRKDEKTGKPLPYADIDLKREQTDNQKFGSASTFIAIGERQNDWLVNKQTGSTSYSWQEPGEKLELHDPAEPFVLYRARAHDIKVLGTDAEGKPTSWQGVPLTGDTDGFMVWIESEPLNEPPK
jgi:hypothetical protein